VKLNILPARAGFAWFRLGIRTFMRQPLALTGLFFMYMAAASLLSLLPVVGSFLALAIVPAATLGLMAATREAAEGRFPTPRVMLSALRAGREQMRAMAVLGVAYAALSLLVLALVPVVVDLPPPAPGDAAETVFGPQMQGAMLLGMALYLPVSLLFWHAPALVYWHGVSPAKSLFFSFVACVRNVRAMLAYGLAWSALVFAVSLAVVLVSLALGSPGLAGSALVPAGVVFTALFTTSLWFTFRDSFVADEAAAPPPAGNDDGTPRA